MDPIQKIRKFGLTMSIAFLLLSGLFFWKHHGGASYFLGVAVLFQGLAWFFPQTLVPIEKIWMKIGHALGWFNTKLLLSVVFFAVLTPIRFLLAILRKDLLDKNIDRKQASYWQIREKRSMAAADYERLY